MPLRGGPPVGGAPEVGGGPPAGGGAGGGAVLRGAAAGPGKRAAENAPKTIPSEARMASHTPIEPETSVSQPNEKPRAAIPSPATSSPACGGKPSSTPTTAASPY